MKIKITVEVDTPAEAKTIIDRMSRDYQTWVDLRGDPAPTGGSAHLDSQLAKIPPKEEDRKNVSPGEPSIGKIGSTTKESLLEVLGEGRQPTDKWAEHLKLLWKRGEVKFDGKEYYL